MTSRGPDTDDADGRQDTVNPSDVFDRMTRPAVTILEAYARVMAKVAEGLSDGPRSGPSGRTEPVGLPAAVMEAVAIASGSSLRYAQRLSELLSRHQMLLTNAAIAQLSDEVSPQRQRAEAEDFRRLLREVSETALLEARRLEHELERLGEAVAQGVAPPGSAEDFQRYWAAKP